MKVKSLYLALFSVIAINGCTTNKVSDEPMCFDDQGEYVECSELTGSASRLPVSPGSSHGEHSAAANMDPSLFKTPLHFQLLSEYVEQMAMDLRRNASISMFAEPVAITSIVKLDNSLQSTSMLGNQLSELFFTQLQEVGIPVSDHKVSGFIQVTQAGDIVMSRNVKDLRHNLNIGYALTGTLIQNSLGHVVNVRIVSLSTNQVVASATKMIPRIVTDKY